MFTGVFGKLQWVVLVITSRNKPEILGYVVHFIFQTFIEFVGRERMASFDMKRVFKSKVKALSLKLHKLKGKIKYNALKVKVVRQILYIH